MGDHNKQKGIAIGDVEIKFPNCNVGLLRNIMHVLGLKRNLLSISKITDMGFSVFFDKNDCNIIDKNHNNIDIGIRLGNLYFLIGPTKGNESIGLNVDETNKSHELSILWHQCLGHISAQRLQQMQDKNLVIGLEKCNFDYKTYCTACIKGENVESLFMNPLLMLNMF